MDIISKIVFDKIESNYSSLTLNLDTKKLELEGKPIITNMFVREIVDDLKSSDPANAKYFTMSIVKDVIGYWTDLHNYIPDKLTSSDNSWGDGLILNDKGGVKDCTMNINYFIKNNPAYKGKVKYNLFRNILEINGDPVSDATRNQLYNDIDEVLGFFSPKKVDSVLASLENDPSISYHPLIDYFNTLVWDGVERISTLMIDWFGSDDNIAVREMSEKWMIGAVKRILHPGCKFDYILMLTGAQGIGKSTFCKRLAKGFGYAENIPIDQPKEYVPMMNDNWIIGMDERGSLSKKDQNLIKNFLTKTEDIVRLSYRRDSSTFKRHCIFIGSTNDEQFLNDYSCSEERRYWVIKCNSTDKQKIFMQFTDDVIDQLWAEAYYKYTHNPDIPFVLSPEAYEVFKEDQKQFKTFTEDDAYLLIKDRLGRGWSRTDFSSDSDLKVAFDSPHLYSGQHRIDVIPTSFIKLYLTKSNLQRSPSQIRTYLEDLGWRKELRWYPYSKNTTQCWVRKDKEELPFEYEETPDNPFTKTEIDVKF